MTFAEEVGVTGEYRFATWSDGQGEDGWAAWTERNRGLVGIGRFAKVRGGGWMLWDFTPAGSGHCIPGFDSDDVLSTGFASRAEACLVFASKSVDLYEVPFRTFADQASGAPALVGRTVPDRLFRKVWET